MQQIVSQVMNLTKKAIIVITLVDESVERSNEELEKEILKELVRNPSVIPWMKNVEKIEVREG